MFGFKRATDFVIDWANDTKGKDNRAKPVLEKILEYLESIIAIWQNDLAYRECDKNFRLSRAKIEIDSSIKQLVNDFLSNLIQNNIEALVSSGEPIDHAIIIVMKTYMQKYSINISNEEEIKKLYFSLEELFRLMQIKEGVKKLLIGDNYSKIYQNCLMINAYRKQNPDLSGLIGSYQDVNLILGEKGEFLLNKVPEAIQYVLSLEELLNELSTELDQIHMRENSRRGR